MFGGIASLAHHYLHWPDHADKNSIVSHYDYWIIPYSEKIKKAEEDLNTKSTPEILKEKNIKIMEFGDDGIKEVEI
jgi:hypothetical protein